MGRTLSERTDFWIEVMRMRDRERDRVRIVATVRVDPVSRGCDSAGICVDWGER